MLVTILLLALASCEAIRMEDTDLVELGQQINDTIANPHGTGLQLTRDAYVYLEELRGIRKDMKVEMPYTFDKLKRVLKHGGPPHIKFDANATVLRSFYKWTNWDEEEFFVIMNHTRKAWKKLLDQDRQVKEKYSKPKFDED